MAGLEARRGLWVKGEMREPKRLQCSGIGKESDRHWEQSEDISLLEFKAIQYKRRGKIPATQEQLKRIEKVHKREFIRRGINQHTLEKICNREAVRASKLAEVLKVLQQWESEQMHDPKRTTVNIY